MRQPVPSGMPSITSNNLSEILDQIEKIQGKIGLGAGSKALEMLVLLDRSAERFSGLADLGREVKAEQAQFEHVVITFRKQAGKFLGEVGGVREIEILRATIHPPESNWWWWPERIVAAQRRHSLLDTLRKVGITAAVLLVLVIAYQLFFKPDPKTIAVLNANQDAQQSFIDGDPVKALAEVEKGLVISPDDSDLLILKACILSLNNSTAGEAQVIFSRAEGIMQNREYYFMTRAQTYYMLGKLDRAKTDAQAVIGENSKSARGYLILGQVLESQRDQQGAYECYQQASDLAGDDAPIAAQARIKMGMLMQSMGLYSASQNTETPSPTP